MTENVSRPATGARRPCLIVNPRSGGGIAGRFRIAERARAFGAQVLVIDHCLPEDLATVARRAVDDGADLLGVAGGDGTQALVAEVAAASGLPFMVIPAGTRNHFAMDLGLDREDPSAALEALRDGVELAKALIDAVGEQGARGRHLMAFFGCLYYAANRPGEAANLREEDFTLPEEGWGEVLLSTSTPRVGSGWTDTGESFDTRGLKRARKATRPVPIPPVLVRLVREHIKEFGTAEDGRLFRAAQGGGLLSKEYGEIWKAARLAVLTESEAASPLADVPYSLRHAGVSLWLESGVSPAEVARRAGHSIAVLFRFYAKAIHRNQQRSNEQIERALEAADGE
ncbi:hypothetical protein GCM10010448_69790 [Streptomyces glomeratus]|uniref:HTH araC/xylS-type domain-containing protein n=1 Tax=Streptomyces glomeratus TaxID=284452 RepID=A0ABP6M4S1_9ACTN